MSIHTPFTQTRELYGSRPNFPPQSCDNINEIPYHFTTHITAIAVNEENDRFYTADANGTIIEWDLTNQTALRTLQPQTVDLLCASGNRLVGRHLGDHTRLSRWRLSSEEGPLSTIKKTRGIFSEVPFNAIAFQNYSLYSARDYKRDGYYAIAVWNAKYHPVWMYSIYAHTDRILSLIVDKHGR